MAENRIGYEFIDKGYFYVQGSNTSDVLRIGSYGDHSAIKLFINNSCDAAYDIGVINSSDPTFYIARSDATRPTFYIRGSDGNIGIGTSTPEYTLDVWGSMRVEILISDSISLSNVGGTNTISTSNTVLNNIIAISGSNGIIDVSNSSLSNVHNIVVNSNATVHDIVVHDTAYIGGDLEIHGVYRHVMGKMQTVYASLGQIMYSTSNLTELGFILSWVGTPNPFELVEVTSDLYGVGCETRFSLDYKKYINPTNNPPSFPGEDFTSSLAETRTDNVTILQPYITRHTSNSVRVGAQWRLRDATDHSASMNVNIFAPISIGSIGLTGYQVLSNLLYTYDMGVQTFNNPIVNTANSLVFGESTYVNGVVRYTHGKMQRIYASVYSDTDNAILGFVIQWDVSNTNEILYVRGKSFSTRGAAEFTKWVPYNATPATVFESVVGSCRVAITRLNDTLMNVSILQDASDALFATCFALEVMASTRIGSINCSPYRTSSAAVTQYYNQSTNMFSDPSASYLTAQDITGVVRNTLGYMQTIHVSLGDALFTTQQDNELGFVVSWTEDCYHNLFEVGGIFTANDSTNQMKIHMVIKEMVAIDDNVVVADIVPLLSTQKTDDVLAASISVSHYGNNSAKITIQWSVRPSLAQHIANLALRIVIPEDLGAITMSGIRIAGNVLSWYNDSANTFTASALTPLTNSGASNSTVVRQLMGATQRIRVAYGNLAFKEIYTNKIGFRLSWPNNILGSVLNTTGSFVAHGATTRIAMEYSSVVHIPNVQNSTTVYVTKLQSDNVAAPVICNLISTSATSLETYLQWSLLDRELHYGTLQMEIIAPMALGELQITAFYAD